jgi:hypothetical protein
MGPLPARSGSERAFSASVQAYSLSVQVKAALDRVGNRTWFFWGGGGGGGEKFLPNKKSYVLLSGYFPTLNNNNKNKTGMLINSIELLKSIHLLKFLIERLSLPASPCPNFNHPPRAT